MPVLTGASETHKLDLAAEVLRGRGAIRIQALGTSMLPWIWPGDVLTIESRLGEEIVPGDIVLVARDGRFFVHRLIEKHGSGWITRGDSLPQNDPPVAESQVLGKISAIYRKGRAIVPNPRVTLVAGMFAGMLCHWDVFRNFALHIHSGWQRVLAVSRSTSVRRHPALARGGGVPHDSHSDGGATFDIQ